MKSTKGIVGKERGVGEKSALTLKEKGTVHKNLFWGGGVPCKRSALPSPTLVTPKYSREGGGRNYRPMFGYAKWKRQKK